MKMRFFVILTVLLPMSIWATPEFNISQTYYKIKGYSADELRNQLNQLGPINNGKRYDAYTSWNVNWNYNWRYDNPSQNPCYITEIKVSVNIISTLPEWEDKNAGDPSTLTKWDNYLAALLKHEDGHIQNGKDAAIEIEKAMLAIPSQSSCKLLDSTIQKTGDDILKKHNAWDLNYDSSTGHGRTQGAVFP